jgi:hypothetical protein
MAEFPANADSSEQREINFRAHEPGINDLRKRIDSVVPYFCANPCCLQAFCPHHGKDLYRTRGCSLITLSQPTIQHGSFLPYRRSCPELQVMVIQKGRPVGASASGKLIRRFK